MKTKLNKIKLFTDKSVANLEKKINSWFKQNKYIEIVQILQSETLTDLAPDFKRDSFNRTITICYKEIEQPSSGITESVAKNKASKETNGLEFLYEQLQDNSDSGS